VLLTKPGKEAGQGVGYLDDGTMVVVERAKALVGREVQCTVTSVLVTANGRLVFTRLDGAADVEEAAEASGARPHSSRGPVPAPPRQPRPPVPHGRAPGTPPLSR
jgi:non-ribosomal peptide synthetase component E (peptide arylation enzyme)